MPEAPSRSAATIRRLCARLFVAGTLWLLWPEASGAEAAAALCACLAVGCALGAVQRHEPFMSTMLNRWFEAVFLLVVAALLIPLF